MHSYDLTICWYNIIFSLLFHVVCSKDVYQNILVLSLVSITWPYFIFLPPRRCLLHQMGSVEGERTYREIIFPFYQYASDKQKYFSVYLMSAQQWTMIIIPACFPVVVAWLRVFEVVRYFTNLISQKEKKEFGKSKTRKETTEIYKFFWDKTLVMIVLCIFGTFFFSNLSFTEVLCCNENIWNTKSDMSAVVFG